ESCTPEQGYSLSWQKVSNPDKYKREDCGYTADEAKSTGYYATQKVVLALCPVGGDETHHALRKAETSGHCHHDAQGLTESEHTVSSYRQDTRQSDIERVVQCQTRWQNNACANQCGADSLSEIVFVLFDGRNLLVQFAANWKECI